MKAYVLKGPGVLAAEEREIPQPGPTEVLIRVTNVGICGSDIHLYKGTYNGPQNYPHSVRTRVVRDCGENRGKGGKGEARGQGDRGLFPVLRALRQLQRRSKSVPYH